MFADKLKEIMKEFHFKQNQVALMTGCSKAAVSQWLSGINVPPIEKQRSIAETFGLEPDFFQKEKKPKDSTRRGLIRKMLPVEAASVLGINQETVRKGLQQGCFPWGYAIHMDSGRWVYVINADKFAEIEGVNV